MIHELKILPEYFYLVRCRIKTFEIRKNDRDFKEGDMLALNEWNTDNGYTGNSILVGVDYILSDPQYVKEGYVIMGISPHEVIRRPDCVLIPTLTNLTWANDKPCF